MLGKGFVSDAEGIGAIGLHAPYAALLFLVGGVDNIASIATNRWVLVGTMMGRQQRTLAPIRVYREQIANLAGKDDAAIGRPREPSDSKLLRSDSCRSR